MKIYNILVICFFAIGLGCQSKPKKLPIIGQVKIVGQDTIYHKIPPFSFVNQDSMTVDNSTLSPHIYLADFFFTSCPSICPKVTKQMLRLHDKYKDNDRVRLVSFTMDPKRDDVNKLKLYSKNLEVSSSKWHFLTGNKDELLDLADDYFVVAYEDDEAPGGFDHSGKILLVDEKGHIRSFAEGTEPESVDELLKDVDILLNE